MARDCASDLCSALEAAGLSLVRPPTSGHNLYASPLPEVDSPDVPDKAVGVVNLGGVAPLPYVGQGKATLLEATARIIVRSPREDFSAGQTLALNVFNAIELVSLSTYIDVRCKQSAPQYAGPDGSDRHRWAIDVELRWRDAGAGIAPPLSIADAGDRSVNGNLTVTGNETVGGTLGVTGQTTLGPVSAGAVAAASVTASGAVSGASVAASGAVTGASVAATGQVSGASANVTGAVAAGSVSSTGTVQGSPVLSGAANGAIGFAPVQSGNTGTPGPKLVLDRNGLAYFQDNGFGTAISCSVNMQLGQVQATAYKNYSGAMQYLSQASDGASAVAHVLDAQGNLVTSGAKLVSFRNNGSEKASVSKDGAYVAASGGSGGFFFGSTAGPQMWQSQTSGVNLTRLDSTDFTVTGGKFRPWARFGLTATAGGGQHNNERTLANINVVDTVATSGDSFTLEVLQSGGMSALIVNNCKVASRTLNIYPPVGGTIDGMAANTPYALASAAGAPTMREFIALDTLNWISR